MEQQTFWRALLVASTILLSESVVTAERYIHELKRQVTVVDWDSCYVRWQGMRQGQTWQQAQVPVTPVWSTTSEQFDSTINNFNNIGDTNAMLWLHSHSALAYAGITSCGQRVDAQSGLNQPDVTGSLILPSGVAKLRRVGPTPGGLDANRRGTSFIFGLANTNPSNALTPDDYAYFKNGNYSDGSGGLLSAIIDWSKQYDADRTAGRPRASVAYLSAITGNGATVSIEISGLFKHHD